jgi:hypothetical protein
LRRVIVKHALLGVASLLALAIATPANAALVVNPDGTITVTGATSGGTAVINFDGNVEGSTVPGLTSQLSLTYAGLVGGDYRFTYSLLNNSTVNSRLSGLAFNTDPNITGGTATGMFTNLLTNVNFPNGIGGVEVCLQDGGSGCAGGGNGGILAGAAPGTGSFTLDFGASTPSVINLSNFAVRYQSIVGVQAGTSGTGRPVGPVPEPGTWAMMLLGFGAIGTALRRSRRRQRHPLQLA